MKIIKVLICLVCVQLAGCTIGLPKEVEDFSKKTKDSYWDVDISFSGYVSIGIYQKINDYTITVSAPVIKNRVPDNYLDFEKHVRDVFFLDSRRGSEGISWLKTEPYGHKFQKPEKNKVVSFNPHKLVFDSRRNRISIDMNRLSNLQRLEEVIPSEWVGYRANYDLTKVPGHRNKGEIVFFVNEERDKLQEVYFHEKKWSFVRHVETGEIGVLFEEDPYKLLQLLWWAWNEKLKPFIDQMAELGVIED